MRRLSDWAEAMRLSWIAVCLGCLLCACAGDRATGGGAQASVYNDWLYHHYHWYDDDFWIWADDQPDCCTDEDDLKEALSTWYDGLDPDEQQAVQDRVKSWMEENGIEPAAGQSGTCWSSATSSSHHFGNSLKLGNPAAAGFACFPSSSS